MPLTGLIFDAQARQSNQGTSPVPTLPGLPPIDISQLPSSVRNEIQYNVLDFGFDNQGNDVNAGPWAKLMAAIGKGAPVWAIGASSIRIIFPAGDYCLTNLSIANPGNLQSSGTLIIEGQGDTTRIFPGGNQGRCITVDSSGAPSNIRVVLADFNLGGRAGHNIGRDLPYNQPMIDLNNCGEYFIQNVNMDFGNPTNGFTGTGIKLTATFNGECCHCYWNCGQYAVPFRYDLSGFNTQGDSIRFQSVVCIGECGPVFDCSGATGWNFDNYKQVGPGSVGLPYEIAESFLAADAAVNDQTITLNAGDGALYSVNDQIAIGEAMTGFGAGFAFEVNKVTAVNGDVLTLQWPLQFAHSSAHHCPVYRGGIGVVAGTVSLGNAIRNSHFEGLGIGVVAWTGTGLVFDNIENSCAEFFRNANSVTDVRFGKFKAAGTNAGWTHPAVQKNVLCNIPTWANATITTTARMIFDGPLVGAQSQLTCTYYGTSYNVDRWGYHRLTPTASYAENGDNDKTAARLSSAGLQLRGNLTMAAGVASGTAICTLPAPFVPERSKAVNVYCSAGFWAGAIQAQNLWVRGSEQGPWGANAGVIQQQIATAGAAVLDLSSVPPLPPIKV